ncbi:hypothetical protein RSal33209_0605 [Renibacterium salmoninarum ATCC 33209]|uniref:Uncharacterized protein n=1 Tax=Renibacterium salmoninarum (strain ATCC 33209 / DSM 20767 / JCM 11484 / NBRC 15589 / NCIMB 2235) TaxID=288705 RepID=A9WLF5_RENSM|nr:hypothetical protein RSal33209_0605 [Renibacterium salmoninarum ATCC 33209]
MTFFPYDGSKNVQVDWDRRRPTSRRSNHRLRGRSATGRWQLNHTGLRTQLASDRWRGMDHPRTYECLCKDSVGAGTSNFPAMTLAIGLRRPNFSVK